MSSDVLRYIVVHNINVVLTSMCFAKIPVIVGNCEAHSEILSVVWDTLHRSVARRTSTIYQVTGFHGGKLG